ncbi:unnamed protein product [Ostreobium quekettii]|uniref:RAP domain-containing protein n=1 Tax=Ostreobium quekettii TaxID=121088 RepID=A0A8S1JB06_9CHLO|nr:unnamed protein product [Ostreobium quekettii]|eukprot:evm.model.scf_272.7 EVM.evm.TU.scf_272.7   scf_272:103149-106259(-)
MLTGRIAFKLQQCIRPAADRGWRPFGGIGWDGPVPGSLQGILTLGALTYPVIFGGSPVDGFRVDNRRACPNAHDFHQTRQSGVQTKKRGVVKQHNYVIQRECSKLLRKFKYVPPASDMAKNIVRETLDYYHNMLRVESNLSPRNGAAMLVRVAKFAQSSSLHDYIIETQQPFLGGVCKMTNGRLFALRPQEVSNVVWALGELGPGILDVRMGSGTIRNLYDKAMRQASDWKVLEKVRCADLALLVIGIAKLEVEDIDWAMEEITATIIRKLVKFKDPDLPGLLGGLAYMGWRDTKVLLPAIAVECKKRVGRFQSQDLAKLLWAFAVLEFRDIQHLLWITTTQTLPHLREVQPQEIVKIVWAYDHLHYYPGESCLAKMSRLMAPNVKKLVASDIAHTLQAFANMGLEEKMVVDSVCDCIIRNQIEGGLSTRDAAVLGWSLAVLDALDKRVFVSLRKPLAEFDPETLPEKHKVDVYRFCLHLQVFRPQLADMVSTDSMAACQGAWIEQVSEWEPPGLASEVGPIMEVLGFSWMEKETIGDGLMAVSSARRGDLTLAVEIVTPPNCYVTYMPSEKPHTAGSFLWRERLLMALGWRVLRVDGGAWEDMANDQEREAYLKERIQPLVGLTVEGGVDGQDTLLDQPEAA